MRYLCAAVLLAGFVLLTNQGVLSQDKKEPPKVKGILPANWGKLDLTVDQKQSIYKIQAKYKEEIAKLKEKIRETELEERREMVKVLTADQKKRLEELATGDVPKKEPEKK